jgi:serine/threonine protein kinase
LSHRDLKLENILLDANGHIALRNVVFGKVQFLRDALTTEGCEFVRGLLNRNPKHRLGAIDGAEELQTHRFFADIDWEALSKKQISPSFKPKIKSETGTSNFDPEFTSALSDGPSLNACAVSLAAGIET